MKEILVALIKRFTIKKVEKSNYEPANYATNARYAEPRTIEPKQLKKPLVDEWAVRPQYNIDNEPINSMKQLMERRRRLDATRNERALRNQAELNRLTRQQDEFIEQEQLAPFRKYFNQLNNRL